MSDGSISDYFTGVAAKRLAAVDAEPESSNQHEVTGSSPLRKILGDVDRKLASNNGYKTTFIWVAQENESVLETGFVSWYDSRRQNKRRSEWRLYYQGNAVTKLMQAGDFLFLARQPNGELLFVIVPRDSELAAGMFWLFNLEKPVEEKFVARRPGSFENLDFAKRLILEELGLQFKEPDEATIEELTSGFDVELPNTMAMAQLVWSTRHGVYPQDDPDAALTAWLDWEFRLFQHIEKKIVSRRLTDGFLNNGEPDVGEFLGFAKSVRGRRSSRMGASLENHLSEVLRRNDIRFSHNAVSEESSRPDFLFPSALEYQDPDFPASRLTMLGAKSTCKDRWRQVLTEADRIDGKHLLTLEPGISAGQTDEMKRQNLQLVVPRELHASYQEPQRAWLWSVMQFIERVQILQR